MPSGSCNRCRMANDGPIPDQSETTTAVQRSSAACEYPPHSKAIDGLVANGGPQLKQGQQDPPSSDNSIEQDVYLSVIVPAYNEEDNIARTAKALTRYLRDRSVVYEIIVVDDGSQDETVNQVLSLHAGDIPLTLFRNGCNRGKGYAVGRGMLAARGEYLFFMDADLSYPVEHMDQMLEALESGYDLSIGSRTLAESRTEIRPPLRRYLAGRAYSLLVQLVLVRGIADTQCGFKGFRRQVARDLFARLTLEDWAFDAELLFLAQKLGYAIKMVPMHLIAQKNSRVQLFRDAFVMALDLFKIRFNDLRGAYDR